MTAIQLYKFVSDNDIEWHYIGDSDVPREVFILIPTHKVAIFSNLLKSYDFSDGGIECTLMDGYFAFLMKDLCEYFGIELSEIFSKDG
jgi:hypothetical protein